MKQKIRLPRKTKKAYKKRRFIRILSYYKDYYKQLIKTDNVYFMNKCENLEKTYLKIGGKPQILWDLIEYCNYKYLRRTK